jgi:two-component system, NarL family, invasion response regulator UvrY
MTVDDQPMFRAIAHELVGAMGGFEPVVEAASGREALEAAERLHPELVLMDVRMPGIGGIEAARRIIQGAGYRVAVVLMSADARLLAQGCVPPGTVGVVSKEGLTPAALRTVWARRLAAVSGG